MKRRLFTSALLSGFLLISMSVAAREDAKSSKRNPKASFKTEAGDCVTPTAQFDLDINNVRARLLTGGDMWWNLSDAKYEVPKGNGTGAPLNAIFSGSIWISGKDAGQNLKVAAQRYRASGDDYWPGPLTNGTVDKSTCNKYDRFFSVYGADITKAQGVVALKGAQTVAADIPKGVLAWPGKGNPYLETDPTLLGETFIIPDNLAPFKDVDGDGIYDPVKGDYPYIPCRAGGGEAFGDQMIFWVINDAGNQHTESNGQAIGVQINSLAFAFQTTDDVNNMTFYKYEIVNKSSNPLYDTYVSQNVDPDLGNFNNDAIGCDTSRSLGIVYNRTTNDGDFQGVAGYGTDLPLLGVDFFEGPIGDNGQELGMTSFIYYTNGGTSDGDPLTAAQYRNYQEGKFYDGSPITVGGTGHGGSVPTNFVYPSNPVDPNGWSEVTANTQMGDRRFVQTTGTFTLNPGVSQYVTIGVVFVRPAGGVGVPPNFETMIGPADDLAQSLFNTCFKLVDGPWAPDLKIRELSNQVIINLENAPTSNNYGESYNQVDGKIALIINSELNGQGDSTYTFEGYRLYQVANPQVSATDLNNSDKAREIATVDLKNGVTKIINFEKDATLGGLYVPVLKVTGKDNGVTTSFNLTTDLFATGDNNLLVNHETYYYTAIAYSYNNYKPYDYNNPGNGGQLTPYLQGGKNFKVYSAIPHIPDPRNEGTQLNSAWGDGVEVKRIEGKGNGGNNLNLKPETIENILNSGSYAFADTLVYQKGFDPIGFKVTDPINLKEGDFEVQFLEDSFVNVRVQAQRPDGGLDTILLKDIKSTEVADASALGALLPQGYTLQTIMSTTFTSNKWKWVLKDFTNNMTIHSDRYLDRPYEQHIVDSLQNDYGFLIKLGTPVPVYSINGNYLASSGSPTRYVYDVSTSSIEYANPLEKWLSFVQDQGTNSVQNWIRSGTTANDPASQSKDTKAAAEAFDDNYYFWGTGTYPANAYAASTDGAAAFDDPNKTFETILNGTWAPYCLTANYAKKNLTNDDQINGKPPFVYGPGFKWKDYGHNYPPQNNLDRIASVDVVITPDKSKWSRCVVFETGEDEAINEGADLSPNAKASRKGQIRMKRSKRWHDPISRDYLEDDPTDIGRSWFPGYAINVETGERLNVAFGESSDMGDQNGRDMLWNPTDKVYSPISFPGQVVSQLPYFGGKHFIYVFETKYDEGDSAHQTLMDNFAGIGNSPFFGIPTALQPFYKTLMWTAIPYLTPGYSFVADQNGNKYIPPATINVKLRVERPYERFATISSNGIDSLPRYQFSTKGMGATEDNPEIAKSALDEIRIVPNPYLAYSQYETDQNSSTVKITNLPNNCKITIYSLDGTIIRKLTRGISVDPATNKRVDISDGASSDQINIDNSTNWDMKNDKGITISSGIYLFHVEAPGIGQRTLKWFGALRPADTSNF